MFDLSEEWERHKKRHDIFAIDMPADLSTMVEKMVSAARLTLTERFLIDAINVSSHNLEEAKRLVNSQVRAWNLPEVNIAVTDVHVKLWELSSAITTAKASAIMKS